MRPARRRRRRRRRRRGARRGRRRARWPPAGGCPGRRPDATWYRPSSPNAPMHPQEVDLAVGPAAQVDVGDRRRRSGGRVRWWPIIRRSAGRANSSKLTSELTGLPGRPNTGTRRRRREQPEGERLGRLDGHLHPPHVGDAAEHRLHDVVVAHADPAARDDGVARRPRRRAAPPRSAASSSRDRRRDRRPSHPASATQRRAASSVALADLARRAAASRRSTSSSPVDSTATRAAGYAATRSRR